ncbi:MAG: GNAT family N-acetyltransferase [Fermentimonas sp.]|jgi:GNAT superfamily N-acetyltransferase
MSVAIKKVTTKDDLRKFIQFGIDLYEGNEYFVPPLIYDEMATLNMSKNPAFEHCDAAYFLAYRGEEIVGRIGVIINHKANEIWKQKNARFSFVDFIDDAKVTDALFATAESWARSRGMEKIHGPLGFTDLDHEGMLIEGFDRMSTMYTIYNYPYYPVHMERMGYVKDQDWLEFLIQIPDEIPERYTRMFDVVKRRFGLTVKRFERKKDVFPYARDIFLLFNKAYKELFGYVELSEKQIDYYVDMYIPLLRLEFLSLILRQQDNKVVGVGIGLPSMSEALRKAKGKFLPTGWIHLYKALKGIGNTTNVLDLLMIAVDPEYQGKGLNALMVSEFFNAAKKFNLTEAETNLELETNNKVHALWGDFEYEQHKRRRAFIKDL